MIQVVSAVGIPKGDPGSACALPAGYRYLIDDTTEEIIEPALLFLCDQFRPIRGEGSLTTVANVAYDLCDWWRFLVHNCKEWDQVDHFDLLSYRHSMSEVNSPRTHQPYSKGTIYRRIGTTLALYKWAKSKGYFDGDITGPTEEQRVRRPIDSDQLAHLSGKRMRAIPKVLAGLQSAPDQRVRPMSMANWKSIANQLGPLPSERSCILSRDRLASELGMWTGARRDEIAHLTKFQILNLYRQLCSEPVPYDPGLTLPLELVWTKGTVKRTVRVPASLILELKTYIDDEREACMKVAREFGANGDHGFLFVNGLKANRHAGKRVAGQTLSRAFHRAVLNAGITSYATKSDPATGSFYTSSIAAHCFHDLRHTFACLLYEALRMSGEPAPWKVVQLRLGHRQLSTTMNTYLRSTDQYRQEINTKTYQLLKAILNA